MLTIAGSFDPTTQINVTFSDPTNGFSDTEPAVQASSSLVAVTVPLFVDPVSGQLGADPNISLQLIEIPSSGLTLTSNGVPFAISALTAPTVPAGSITVGLLQAALDFAPTLTAALSTSTIDSSQLNSALSDQTTSITQALGQITSVYNGSSSSASLGTIGGVAVTVNVPSLAQSDLILGGLISSLANTPGCLQAQAQTIELDIFGPTTAPIQSDLDQLYVLSLSSACASVNGQSGSASKPLVAGLGVVNYSNVAATSGGSIAIWHAGIPPLAEPPNELQPAPGGGLAGIASGLLPPWHQLGLQITAIGLLLSDVCDPLLTLSNFIQDQLKEQAIRATGLSDSQGEIVKVLGDVIEFLTGTSSAQEKLLELLCGETSTTCSIASLASTPGASVMLTAEAWTICVRAESKHRLLGQRQPRGQ